MTTITDGEAGSSVRTKINAAFVITDLLAAATAFGAALAGSVDAAAARTTLALGALATVTPGTGVATALAINVGSAGAPVLFNGAGGTPSSLVLTNASGTVTNLTLVTPTLGVAAATSLALTPAANTSALTSTGFSLTGSNAQSLVDYAGTWNTSGTPTGLTLNITDTASATLSRLQAWKVGGTEKAGVIKDGSMFADLGVWKSAATSFNGSGYYGMAFTASIIDFYNPTYSSTNPAVRFSPSSTIAANFGQGISLAATGAATAADVFIVRDAANTLAQRNGTTTQITRFYDTFTDLSNYRRFSISHSGGDVLLESQTAGTGTAGGGDLSVRAGTGKAMNLGSAATDRFQITSAGHFLAIADNTYDIGASGATRPRALYLAGGITTGSTTLHTTSVALTDGAGASAGTLANAPAVGNPTKWIPINDNGTTRYIPAW